MKYQKKQVIKGIAWSGIDKVGTIIVQLLLEIILARYLLPKDYGIVGIAMIFVALGYVLSESGFSNALIQKKNRTEIDYSTAFYFNTIISLLIYIIVFIISPYISVFFESPYLTNVLRVITLSIVFNALIMVHKTKLTLNLNFKKQAQISFLSVLISGIIGVFLAVYNYGVWALVIQILLQNFINLVLFSFYIRWKPLFVLSKTSFYSLFGFAYKLMLANVIQNIYTNLYNVFIGKRFTESTLGIYAKSNQFTVMPASVISGVLQRVMFPYFSSIQNDNDKINRLNIDFTAIICLLVLPVFLYLSIFSEPIVLYVLSKNWIESVKIIRILAIAVVFFPIIVNNMILFQVKNKEVLYLNIEIVTKILGLIILILTYNYGLLILSYGILITQIIQLIISSVFINTVLNKKKYQQIFSIMPYLFYSVVIYIILLSLRKVILNDILFFFLFGTLIYMIYYSILYVVFEKKKILSLVKLLKKK